MIRVISMLQRAATAPAAILVALMVLLAGCASSSSGPAAKVAPTALQPEVRAQWEQMVAVAKKEGKVVISGNNIESERVSALKFHDAYPDIQVEFIGLEWAPFEARVRGERAAGQYLWDLKIGGLGSTYYLGDEGWFQPLKPALILPDILDDSKWLGGFDAGFGTADPGRQFQYGFVAALNKNVWVNRSLLSAAELSSVDGLISPKWNGQIAMRDPRLVGVGLTQTVLLRKELGDEAARKLLTEQKPVIVEDLNQITEWLVRGRYPIAIVSSSRFGRFQQEGLGKDLEALQSKLVSLGGGAEAIALMDRAPHPNAAKVFLNWVLSRDVQEQWAKTLQTNSRRLDVPPGDPDTKPDPARFKEYIQVASEENAKFMEATRDWVKQLLP